MFPLNTFNNLCVFFLLLMIYSAAGWVGEMVYCSVGKGHICEKRGFLNGFICPIYGHGALLVLYVLHGGFKNPILTFLGGMVLTTALEYFTSWFMEKLFHVRWWYYSKKKIQISGRVCLLNSVLFGLACVLLCHVVNPPVMAWLFRIGEKYTVPAASFLFGIYLMDNILSVRSAIQLSNRTEKLHQLQQEVRQHLAAAAESFSHHPIAQSVVAAYGKPIEKEIEDAKDHTGRGIEAVIGGRHIYAGNERLMKEIGVSCAAVTEVGTVIHMAADKDYLGYLVIADTPKPDSAEAIRSLKAEGVEKTVMLTGDAEPVAKAVSAELGLDEYLSLIHI